MNVLAKARKNTHQAMKSTLLHRGITTRSAFTAESINQTAIAKDLISLAGLQDYATVITGAGDETLRKPSQDGKIDNIDFLFLDHAEDQYDKDLKVAMDELKLLRGNSCIVADNVLRPGAPKYREYVRNHEV